jgi:hypothetical protein
VTPLDLDALKLLAEKAKEQSGSGRWNRSTPREDGTAQVYSPCRGPMRAIVPVAETSDECGAYIAAVSPDVVLALIARIEHAESFERERWAKAAKAFGVVECEDD